MGIALMLLGIPLVLIGLGMLLLGTKSQRILGFVLGIAGGLLLLFSKDSLGIVVGIVEIGCICGIMLSQSKVQSQNNAINYFQCNADGTAILTGHCSEIRSLVEIEKIMHFSTSYHPANYVYTSATVGNVTTGGITKTGDYTSLDGYATNKYKLVYTYQAKNINATISKIRLTNKELVDEAKMNKAVSEFLVGNTLILEHKNVAEKYSSDIIASFMKSGDLMQANQMIEYNNEAKALSESECRAVLSWVCNGN